MAIPNFKAFVSSKVKGQLYGFAANVFHINGHALTGTTKHETLDL
jgi:hypothetical protein